MKNRRDFFKEMSEAKKAKITFTLDPELAYMLSKFCELDHVSMSHLISNILSEYAENKVMKK
ncbi:hypothetical protein MUP77_15545 [Candidatus Bathyarchaeota archaeon]|nr:hypothetical protein [Candidatus Bathyarchaeota archaeon]